MVELQVHPLTKVFKSFLRILRIGEESLASSDFPGSRRFAVPLNPCAQQRLDLLKLLRVLKMKAVVVVIVFGAGDELFQRNRAVGGKSEILDITDFPRPREC